MMPSHDIMFSFLELFLLFAILFVFGFPEALQHTDLALWLRLLLLLDIEDRLVSQRTESVMPHEARKPLRGVVERTDSLPFCVGVHFLELHHFAHLYHDEGVALLGFLLLEQGPALRLLRARGSEGVQFLVLKWKRCLSGHCLRLLLPGTGWEIDTITVSIHCPILEKVELLGCFLLELSL